MKLEKFIEKVEQNIKGLKVDATKTIGEYTSFIYSIGDKKFQIVGTQLNKVNNDNFARHLLEINRAIEREN